MGLEASSRGTPGSLHPLFTLGHSTLDFEPFAKILQDHCVALVCDVRSSPRSSRSPHFSQPAFEKLLENGGVAYLYLGEELGGRPDDLDAYRQNGLVDYRTRRKAYAFRAGVERVLNELEKRSAALLCAEEDPLECHRFLMICPELVRCGIQPQHIRKDSSIETQEAAETRLLIATGFDAVATNTLFQEARAQALEDAYQIQAERVAFRVSPLALDRY